MIRPVFIDERLAEHNGSNEPQYDIVSGGNVVVRDAVLRLRNSITTQGTLFNGVNITNLYDFDNMDSMRGFRKVVVFNVDGSITENVTAIGFDVVVARRETSFPNAEVVRVETTVFADNGVDVLRRTTVDSVMSGGGIVEEVRG